MTRAGMHLAARASLGFTAVLLISLSNLGLARAESIPQQAISLQQKEAIADKFCHDRLAVWQKRLNLDQWKISVSLVRDSVLKPKTLGNIHWDRDELSAAIEVQSAADYKLPMQAMLDDMEFTVVHELVHLRLSNLPRSEASRGAEEHTVNELTRSLLNLAKNKPQ